MVKFTEPLAFEIVEDFIPYALAGRKSGRWDTLWPLNSDKISDNPPN